MIPESPLAWRRRLVVARGLAITTFALLFLMLSRTLATGIPDVLATAVLALLGAPSLLFFATAGMDDNWQPRLLWLDLALDTGLFLVFLAIIGGSHNPIAFYLLLPILLAALSSPAWLATAFWLVTCVALAALPADAHISLPGSPVHAMTHNVDPVHALGMWLIFAVLGLVLILLGQGLQREWRQRQTRSGTLLELGLQRERMYELAARQAHLAHEINTPLGTLIWGLEDLQALPPETVRADMDADLAQLSDSARRIADVIKRGPSADLPPAPCPLDRLVQWLASRMSMLAPGMEITLAASSDNPVLDDLENWSRILLNLAYNASDAGATRLVLECSGGETGLILQVSDDGPGHEPARPEGSGLGIGMALIQTALARMAGRLSQHQTAQWTVWKLDIPKKEAKPR